MSTDPGAQIRGPFEDKDGSIVTGGFVGLWGVEKSRTDAKTNLNVSNVPGMSPDEAILGGFLGNEEFSVSGKASANRLAGGTRDTNTGLNRLTGVKETALKEYALRLESLATSGQGVGYEYEDPRRDVVFTPSDTGGILVKSVDWERTKGDPYTLEWNVDCVRAKGVKTATTTDRSTYIENIKEKFWIESDFGYGIIPRYITFDDEFNEEYEDEQAYGEIIYTGNTPSDSDTDLFGNFFDLGTIDTKRFERKVPINIKELALSAPGENLAVEEGSPTDNMYIEGSIIPEALLHRNFVDNREDAISRLKTFSRFIPENWVGTNKEVTYVDTFMDRTFKGQINKFSTAFAAGQPVQLNYTLEIQKGSTIGGSDA